MYSAAELGDAKTTATPAYKDFASWQEAIISILIYLGFLWLDNKLTVMIIYDKVKTTLSLAVVM